VTITRRVFGSLLLIVGGVWFFQGIGVIHGSFMTNSVRWEAIGAIVAVVGIALVAWPGRRPER